MKPLPISLRTLKGEKEYAKAKNQRELIPLSREPVIKRWNFWKLITNRFPYDVAFQTHHILIPTRQVAEKSDLTKYENDELEEILTYFVEPVYDMYFINTKAKRSVKNLFHIHLVRYHDKREDMKL